MTGLITKEYISATSKSFISNDNNGKMIEKNFIEIEGTFLLEIHDKAFHGNKGDDVFKHINDFLEETNDENDPDVIDYVPKIFKIEDNLFHFDSPLWIAFEELNHFLKIDPDLFTYDIQGFMTYDEYEQELNNKTQGDKEPWSENGVQYQLCDHICEPYRFKNGNAKWPTCTSHIDGFCNGGKLLGMVQVGTITYFQDHSWYDELPDGKLKDETLALKTKVEGSWGDATPGMINICKWLKNCFENFYELEYEVKGDHEANNVSCDQEDQEHKDDPIPEPSNCKVRRFEMMKYSFNDKEEYITIKESEHLSHSKKSLDVYRELLHLTNEGWVVTTPNE
ncbi:hypothetical protein Tco_0419062 [Tanacetum coccineum]